LLLLLLLKNELLRLLLGVCLLHFLRQLVHI
jgi:hypothetical protein